MALIERTLYGTVNKPEAAVQFIKDHCPPEGYFFGDSGGKDSGVVRYLVSLADVRFEAHYNVTTIDPPPIVRFLKAEHPETIWDRPKRPLLVSLITNGAPDRRQPWCCGQYKERRGAGRVCVLGVRREESTDRSARRFVELCWNDPSKRIVNPILDWSTEDVWEYTRAEKIPYCDIYDHGRTRAGCLFCPKKNIKDRQLDLLEYPNWARAFVRYFQKRVDHMNERKLSGYGRWSSGQEFFNWWITTESP